MSGVKITRKIMFLARLWRNDVSVEATFTPDGDLPNIDKVMLLSWGPGSKSVQIDIERLFMELPTPDGEEEIVSVEDHLIDCALTHVWAQENGLAS
jgi:hypothetical protein|tara:strand:+ start:218 stop:505 length:288 start_codon:yes stop_codon:yes gene_type:complete